MNQTGSESTVDEKKKQVRMYCFVNDVAAEWKTAGGTGDDLMGQARLSRPTPRWHQPPVWQR